MTPKVLANLNRVVASTTSICPFPFKNSAVQMGVLLVLMFLLPVSRKLVEVTGYLSFQETFSGIVAFL